MAESPTRQVRGTRTQISFPKTPDEQIQDNYSPPQRERQSTTEVPLEDSTIEEMQGHAEEKSVSTAQAVLIILSLAGISVSSSMSTGLFTIGIPVISADIGLAENLQLWPVSVCSLSSCCTLLLAGSLADLLGNRIMNLLGGCLLGFCILASGLSKTGTQLIVFRAIQGLAISMVFPTSFSILTQAFPNGRLRNIAFSCTGLAQPFGWAIGLFVAGVFQASSLGWRFGFYLCAGTTMTLSAISCWKLPRDRPREPVSWARLSTGIDWIGALLASISLGLLSYELSVVTGNLSSIRDGQNVAFLCIACAMAPTFVYWMHRQEKQGRPVLIPNSIWRNVAFATMCIMVLLSWAVMNSMELFLSLFFQQVQELSAIETSMRFLPNVLVAIFLNLSTGLLVHRFRADYMVLFTTITCTVAPLLMAVINPQWPFWECAIFVVILHPLSADVIFTIANLIITDVFPANMQALAGAVFNTVAQAGTSIGIGVTAMISAGVIKSPSSSLKNAPEALMAGYRAVFWTCFATLFLSCFCTMGLRGVGRVGLKRE
ncbi:MAG: hypothetical protein M1818_004515 [Claussenomyces sp. TS43310]|nr:MAG: hypothetical protein M1818_004515 [Claussenomyces sp. TS43310]